MILLLLDNLILLFLFLRDFLPRAPLISGLGYDADKNGTGTHNFCRDAFRNDRVQLHLWSNRFVFALLLTQRIFR